MEICCVVVDFMSAGYWPGITYSGVRRLLSWDAEEISRVSSHPASLQQQHQPYIKQRLWPYIFFGKQRSLCAAFPCLLVC